MNSAIEVFIRARPTNRFAHDNLIIDEEKGTVQVKIPRKAEGGLINNQQDNWNFKFDKILLNESQESVFELTGQRAVESVVDGISSTVIAYGQTGAGKTFTVIGLNNDYRYRGMIPRCISDVFRQISKRTDVNYKVLVSYVEIYNENIHDLLHPDLNANITLQEDPVHGVISKGATIVEVRSEEEALGLMFQGEVNRTICEHKLNKQSSRSHAIFTITIESRAIFAEKLIVSKLNIVDLAGSERTKKTNSEGSVLLEASFINKSLSYLEQLVVAFNTKNRDCLPYRQSKLTYLLKDSLGGNCKTIFIANIWPEAAFLEESISTFRFASRMSQVVNHLEKKTQLDTQALIRKYERTIKELKAELAMHDTLVGRGKISYESYTPEQQYEQQKLAKEFLDNEIDDIEIESLRQVKELFFQFKNLYRSLAVNQNHIVQNESKSKPVVERPPSEKGEGQGKIERTGGFGLGTAPLDSKPKLPEIRELKETKDFKDHKETKDLKENLPPMRENLKRQPTDDHSEDDDLSNLQGKLDKKQLFEHYKENQGIIHVEKIKSTINQIKECSERLDLEKRQCQGLKQNVDELQIMLKSKYPDIADIEELEGDELNDVLKLKGLKRKHKKHHEEYRYLKKRLNELETELQGLKQKCINDFNESLKNNYNIDLEYFDRKDSMKRIASGTHDDMNSQEEIFAKALHKFESLSKARRLEKLTMV